MDCDKIHPLLTEMQEGTISPEEKKLVESHLAACVHCTQDFKLIGEVFNVLLDVRSEEPPSHYFSNLLPRIRHRIEGRERMRFFLPAWVQRYLAPASTFAILGSLVGLYVLLNPMTDTAQFPLRQIVSELPKDEIEGVAESMSYSAALTRAMEPSQRLLETMSNPSLLSLGIERTLVDDEVNHGHRLSISLAADNSFEDISDEEVDSVIQKLDASSL